MFLDHLCLDPVTSEQAAQQIMFPLPAFPQQVVLHYRGLKKTTILASPQLDTDHYLPSTANNVPIASFPTIGSCAFQRLDRDDYLPSTLSRSVYNENQPQYPNPGNLMTQTVLPQGTAGTMNTYTPNMAIFADNTCTFQQQTMEARTQGYIYQGMSFNRYFSI